MLSPSLRPVTRPTKPPLASGLKVTVTSLPSTVTVGAALAPVTLSSASPPVTSSGRDERTSTLTAANACEAVSDAAAMARDADGRHPLRFILFLLDFSGFRGVTLHERRRAAQTHATFNSAAMTRVLRRGQRSSAADKAEPRPHAAGVWFG